MADRFERLRAHCLSQEGAREVFQWGCAVFKVYGKVFALVGEEAGPHVSLKADPAEREALLAQPHIIPAPYMHHNGWVRIQVANAGALREAKDLISISHKLILDKIPKSKRSWE